MAENETQDFWAKVRQYQEALTAFHESQRMNAIVLGLMELVEKGQFTVGSDLRYRLEFGNAELLDKNAKACVELMEAVNTMKWAKL